MVWLIKNAVLDHLFGDVDDVIGRVLDVILISDVLDFQVGCRGFLALEGAAHFIGL